MTENRNAEIHDLPDDGSRALRLKTEEFDSLLQALPDIYFRLDAAGCIVAWHAGRESELHVPPEAFLGRRPEDVVPPDVGPIIGAAVEQVRSSRELTIAEYTLATPSGDDQFEARLVPCGAGGVTAIIRNTTAWRRAEAALRSSEEKLRCVAKAGSDRPARRRRRARLQQPPHRHPRLRRAPARRPARRTIRCARTSRRSQTPASAPRR